MKVAVIGAGFCGLAVLWHLLNADNKYEVTLFDENGIGGGASGIAAGLLHPYVGASAKLNWKGKQGFEAARRLLTVSSEALGRSVFDENQGILRLALTEKQMHEFQKSPALEDPHVSWLEPWQSQSLAKGCTNASALWIRNGLSIFPDLYLQGLWKACVNKGARFEKRHISSLIELKEYSTIISTTGALTKHIVELEPLPIKVVKGQILELEWPACTPALPCSLISQAYIVMKPNSKSCIIGSTYEKNFSDAHPNLSVAKNEILPKALAMLPALQKAKIMNCYAGLRAVTPDHLPLLKQIGSKEWVLTGMGSKGLLYHALMAQELVNRIKAHH